MVFLPSTLYSPFSVLPSTGPVQSYDYFDSILESSFISYLGVEKCDPPRSFLGEVLVRDEQIGGYPTAMTVSPLGETNIEYATVKATNSVSADSLISEYQRNFSAPQITSKSCN